MHQVLVNRLGGLSLPRKSVVRLTDRPDMTLDVYYGRKTTNQHRNSHGKRAISVQATEVLLYVLILEGLTPILFLCVYIPKHYHLKQRNLFGA